MLDREKVLNALRCLSNPFDDERDCDNCSYDYCSCVLDVTADALELLNEEPIPPIEKHKAGMYFVCGNCQYEFGIVDGWPNYCPDCGRRVAWDDERGSD